MKWTSLCSTTSHNKGQAARRCLSHSLGGKRSKVISLKPSSKVQGLATRTTLVKSYGFQSSTRQQNTFSTGTQYWELYTGSLDVTKEMSFKIITLENAPAQPHTLSSTDSHNGLSFPKTCVTETSISTEQQCFIFCVTSQTQVIHRTMDPRHNYSLK